MRALAIVAVGALAAAGLAPASVTELTIDPVAKRPSDKTVVVVSGRIVCTEGEFAYVRADVTQSWAHGDGLSQTLSCDGTSQTWNVAVRSRKSAFHLGKARAWADATTFDEEALITGGFRAPERMIRIAE